MPDIFIKRSQKKIAVPIGANLMHALKDQQIPVASSCGGDGVCHKCFLTIEQGVENLSAPTPTEIYLVQEKQISPQQRLSCQCKVLGNITVHAPYW